MDVVFVVHAYSARIHVFSIIVCCVLKTAVYCYVVYVVIQAREKQLQQQVSSLQQLVDNLRADLNSAKKRNEDLLKRLNEMVMLCNLKKSHAVYYSLNQCESSSCFLTIGIFCIVKLYFSSPQLVTS